MAAFLDVCRFFPTTGSTTDWTVSIPVTGYQTPASAQAVDGTVYRYRAESSDLTQWEVGYGAYTVAGTTLARTTVLFNSLGTTAKVNFTTTPQVAVVIVKEDVISITEANTFTATEQDRARQNVAAAGGLAFQVNRNNVDQTVVIATFTKVQHTTKPIDVASAYDAVTNFRFQPTISGWYWIVASCAGQAAVSDSTQAAIYKNGAAEIYGIYVTSNSTGDGYSTAEGLVFLNGSTDYVEHWAYIPGGTLIRGATTKTRFDGFKVAS